MLKTMPKQVQFPKFSLAQFFVSRTRPMNEKETSIWRGQALGFAPKNK